MYVNYDLKSMFKNREEVYNYTGMIYTLAEFQVVQVKSTHKRCR